MNRRSVFKARDRLLPDFPIETVWDSLPHREAELGILWDMFKHVLERPMEAFPRVVQVIGPAGSGKTCTLRLFGRRLENRAREAGLKLRSVYLNLRVEGGRRTVLYRNLVRKIDPKLVSMSLSAEEILGNMVRYLQDTGLRIFLVIDEIDYYVRHFKGEGVVYDLTRLNELTPGRPCGVVGAAFLARERGFHKLLDPAELSTLGRVYLVFQPYTSRQVAEILAKRAEEALYPGTYSDEILEFIADVTAEPPVNGDMRYALDLLLYSGILADREGSPVIRPEHVRRVHSQTHPQLTTEDILCLPDEEKLVLLALARALSLRKTPYVPLREIREMTRIVCEEYGREPIEEVDEYVQDLADRRIVDVRSLTRIGISNAPAEDLDRFLVNIIQRLKGGLLDEER
ncbi:hypothetical protein CW710_01885 [Candidatus Bathyarchaeota archaeon]|nr:MAG: hypothetical protein CW710_01885 [Candidatus Bathyarchaeota archaeon]